MNPSDEELKPGDRLTFTVEVALHLLWEQWDESADLDTLWKLLTNAGSGE